MGRAVATDLVLRVSVTIEIDRTPVIVVRTDITLHLLQEIERSLRQVFVTRLPASRERLNIWRRTPVPAGRF